MALHQVKQGSELLRLWHIKLDLEESNRTKVSNLSQQHPYLDVAVCRWIFGITALCKLMPSPYHVRHDLIPLRFYFQRRNRTTLINCESQRMLNRGL